jgi:ELWxxDGT repeat protein
MVKKLRPGPEGSLPIGLRPIGDRLYFSAVDGDRQQQPWRTDGTAAGTERIGAAFDPIGLAYPSGFTSGGSTRPVRCAVSGSPRPERPTGARRKSRASARLFAADRKRSDLNAPVSY